MIGCSADMIGVAAASATTTGRLSALSPEGPTGAMSTNTPRVSTPARDSDSSASVRIDSYVPCVTTTCR